MSCVRFLCCYLAVIASAGASNLYRDDVVYFTDRELNGQIERLSALESPDETSYLTQIALEKPEVFVRQLRVARDLIAGAPSVASVRDELQEAGFFSPEVQQQIAIFFSEFDADSALTTADAHRLVIQMNDQTDAWTHLLAPESDLDPFTGLECAPNQVPTELTGPPAHQYLLQVAHPNMELTIWRYDPNAAIRYPVGAVSETSVDQYQFVSRFGQPLARLNRQTLEMVMGENTLACQKISAPVMQAYQNHRREVILAEKQL
jgi:hypothetical protein